MWLVDKWKESFKALRRDIDMEKNEEVGSCGVRGCPCGESIDNVQLNVCHGCDGYGWVEVECGAVICPVCGGSGEYHHLPPINWDTETHSCCSAKTLSC